MLEIEQVVASKLF